MAKKPEVHAKLQAIAGRSGVTVPWDRITINRWRPDTCDCVIEQWFDDDNPGVVFYAFTESPCAEHTATDETLWLAIRGENGRKNAVVNIAATFAGISDVKERVRRIMWSFEANRLAGSEERVIQLGVTGVNNNVLNQIQSAADLQFGTGAVVVS